MDDAIAILQISVIPIVFITSLVIAFFCKRTAEAEERTRRIALLQHAVYPPPRYNTKAPVPV